MFTQVDNVGKNSMFDSWINYDDIKSLLYQYDGKIYPYDKSEGKYLRSQGIPVKTTWLNDYEVQNNKWKLYPRPYDMDSQMGESNAGFDIVPYYAEINPYMSPITIEKATQLSSIIGGVDNAQIFTSSNELWNSEKEHDRYKIGYNIRHSKLWDKFYKLYESDIRECYAYLRNEGIYTVENICNAVDSITSNQIGESFYNKDAVIKYLSQNNYSEHAAKLQGNRSIRYKQYLRKRLEFLDTFFRYQTGNSTNKSLNTKEPYPMLGIDVHEPQYVTIEVSDERITTFIDPNYQYATIGGSKDIANKYGEDKDENTSIVKSLKRNSENIPII